MLTHRCRHGRHEPDKDCARALPKTTHSRLSKMICAAALIAIAIWTGQPILCASDASWQSSDKQRGPSVFVIGGVTNAGQYRFEPGMTVADAISAAGGSDPAGAIEIRRRTADGLEVKPAKLSDELLANDTVAVGRVRKGRPRD